MSKREFYLKKVGCRGEISIWVVDGKKIRDSLDPEFTNYGFHYCNSYIPEKEFWIDKEAAPDEKRFFIAYMATVWKLMRSGWTYKQAVIQGELVERAERQKAKVVKELFQENYSDQIKTIHKYLAGKIADNISVWIVDGKLVRALFYIDFTEGGHYLVYPFVPKKEIWLDNDLMVKERSYVLLHEACELGLMARGLTYDQAHRKASRVEWQCRSLKKDILKYLADYRWEEEKHS